MSTSISLSRFWVGAALLLSLGACSSEGNTASAPANRITFNDFENADGWVTVSPSLNKEKAHSGRFSVKVQPGVDYGLGYGNMLNQVSASKFQKLTVKGWALRSGPKATAVIVVQVIDAAGKSVFYQTLPLDEVAPTINKWSEFSRDFILPATITADQALKVYLWRASAEQAAYLDDFELLKG